MEYCTATLADMDQVKALLTRYHLTTISAEDKPDGFVTTQMSDEQMANLIENEQGLFIAKQDGNVVAFVMAASWQFWSPWPLFAHMIDKLGDHSFAGQTLSMENSYQYGPVCIDTAVRGKGVLEGLFAFALEKMSLRFDILVTFINKVNPRSYAAHTRKLGLTVLDEFEFNNNHYYWLVCETR